MTIAIYHNSYLSDEVSLELKNHHEGGINKCLAGSAGLSAKASSVCLQKYVNTFLLHGTTRPGALWATGSNPVQVSGTKKRHQMIAFFRGGLGRI